MHVYLLRHGRAEEHHPQGDAARALTPDGAKRLRSAARVFRKLMLQPEQIFTSPLRRAAQTAEILASELGFTAGLVETPALTPAAHPSAALDLLHAELLDSRQAVVLVGHEPHLGSLLGLLLTGSESCPVPLKKGMLASVLLEGAQSMIGRLQLVLPQRVGSDLG